jgi:hypothetical protein
VEAKGMEYGGSKGREGEERKREKKGVSLP